MSIQSLIMGNEMGNQNSSGIKGEENEAANANENVQVSVCAAENDVKGENHIKPEVESKDYHEKTDQELSNHDKEAAIINSEIKFLTSNDKEENEGEPKPPAKVVLKEEMVCEAIVEDKISESDTNEDHEKKPSTEKDLKFEAQEYNDVPTETTVEDDQDFSFIENNEFVEESASGECEKGNNHLIYTENPLNHNANAVSEEEKRVDLIDKSVAINSLEENSEITSSEYTVDENSLETEENGDVPPEMKPKDVLQPIDNFTILTDKIESIARESENVDKKHDLLQNEDAAYPTPEEVDHIEEAKVINNVNQIGLADHNNYLVSLSQAHLDTEKVIEMEPEVIVPTEISFTTANNEDEKVTEDQATMESDEEEKDKSYITGNESDREKTLDKNILQFESSEKENCLYIATRDGSDVNPNDEIENQEAERESEQKIHSIPETIAEADQLPPEQPQEQYLMSETSTPFADVVPANAIPESVGRHSVESNPEKSCERIELRKCPSFDFGIPIDHARSEESDQTPLLRQDKTVFRSLSSCSNMTFHSANGRSSLDYDQVVAEEKTIRMERSDSVNSISPFSNLIKKEDVSKSAIITPQIQEIHSKNAPLNELEISSPRGSGKRKAKSSFFTTCLCCTAAIS